MTNPYLPTDYVYDNPAIDLDTANNIRLTLDQVLAAQTIAAGQMAALLQQQNALLLRVISLEQGGGGGGGGGGPITWQSITDRPTNMVQVMFCINDLQLARPVPPTGLSYNVIWAKATAPTIGAGFASVNDLWWPWNG